MFVPQSPSTSTAEEETRLRNNVVANTIKAAAADVVPVALLAGNDGIQTHFNLTMVKQVLDGDDWKRKVSVLRQLQEALAEGTLAPPNPGELVPFMESMAKLFRELKDTKPDIHGGSRITQLAAGVVGGLAKTTKGELFCGSAAGIIPELLPFLSTPREAVQESVTACVKAMLTECHSPGVLRAATLALINSKKAHQRRKASSFLCVAIERWPQASLHATLSPIMGMMRKSLLDADATVRREGRHTFGAFIKIRPAEGGGMYHGLDRAIQRAILQEQPHVSNFIGGKTGPAPTKERGGAGGGGDKDGNSWMGPPALVGGGGGQRPAGVTVTQAQQLNLLRWKREKEKEKEREKEKHRESVLLQERRAAAELGAATSAPNSPAKNASLSYSYTSAVATGTAASNGTNAASVGGEKKRSGMVSGVPSPKAGIAGRRRGGSGVGDGDGDGLVVHPGGITRSPGSCASKVSCSQRLRDAAKVALRKHDLLSPTMKKLLQEETDKMSAVVAGGGCLRCDAVEKNGTRTSPHASERNVVSAESSHGGDSTVESGGGVGGSPLKSPRSQQSQGPEDGADVDVSRTMTPAELRQSMAGDDKEYMNSAAATVPVNGEAGGVMPPGALGGRSRSGSGVSDGARSNGDIGGRKDGGCEGREAGGNFTGTTRMLFANVKAEEGNGERKGTRKGDRSTIGDKSRRMAGSLSQRAPSSLPTISPPSSPRSNPPDDHMTPPPSGEEDRRSTVSSAAGAASASTKDLRSQGLNRSLTGSPLSVATEASMLLHDDVKTPKRHAVLTGGGSGTRGRNTEARRQVRFTNTIDAGASTPGSLTSPCNADSNGRSAARESWSTPTGHESLKTTATAATGRGPFSSLRLALLNVFLLMSTLGAFAVLSLMLAIQLEDHDFMEKNPSPLPDMIAEPPATETTTQEMLSWVLPHPEPIMTGSVPRLLVENNPPGLGSRSAATGQQAMRAGSGDAGTAKAEDVRPQKSDAEPNARADDLSTDDEEHRKENTTVRGFGGAVAEERANVNDPPLPTMDAVEMPRVTKTEAADDSPSEKDEGVEVAAVERSCESAAATLDVPPAVGVIEVGIDNEDIADAAVVAAVTEVRTDVNADSPVTTADKVETPMVTGEKTGEDSPPENNKGVGVAATESSCESSSATLEVPSVEGVVEVGAVDEVIASAGVAATVTEEPDDVNTIPPAATVDTVETPVVTELEAAEESPSEKDEGVGVAATESSCESSSAGLDVLPAEGVVEVGTDGEDIAKASPKQPRLHHQAAELPQTRKENGGEIEATVAVASSGSAMETEAVGSVFPAHIPAPVPAITTKEGSGGRSLSTTTAEATVSATFPTTTSPAGSYQRRAIPWPHAKSTADFFNRPHASAVLGAGWGWLEFWVAMAGAVALLASVVWVASVNREEGLDTRPSEVGAGTTEGGGPTTPTKNGDTHNWELGTYTTVEVVKTGNTPATVRSVKRSRRISSAHKSSGTGTVVMDLGATATTLDLN